MKWTEKESKSGGNTVRKTKAYSFKKGPENLVKCYKAVKEMA